MPLQSDETHGILLASFSHAIAFHASRWFMISITVVVLLVLAIISTVSIFTYQFSAKCPQLMDSLAGALVLAYFYLVVILFSYNPDSENVQETKTVFIMGASDHTIFISLMKIARPSTEMTGHGQ
ncbi:hypothetical protein ARMGADRAFT_1034375 [Armillaria gallica]|uniref:Uncharacterized protein n=1 Tax=Armillaria gallica TaxID=47427 RepID=A0A2H3DIP2_ARMGA|nr:hypothetical protein ARMGADRAFT_1034375 [Armillaria gallica]